MFQHLYQYPVGWQQNQTKDSSWQEERCDFTETAELEDFAPSLNWGLRSGEFTDVGSCRLKRSVSSPVALLFGLFIPKTSCFICRAFLTFLPHALQTRSESFSDLSTGIPTSSSHNSDSGRDDLYSFQLVSLNRFSVAIYSILSKLLYLCFRAQPHSLQKSFTLSSFGFLPLFTGFFGVVPFPSKGYYFNKRAVTFPATCNEFVLKFTLRWHLTTDGDRCWRVSFFWRWRSQFRVAGQAVLPTNPPSHSPSPSHFPLPFPLTFSFSTLPSFSLARASNMAAVFSRSWFFCPPCSKTAATQANQHSTQ